jgi:transcription elongation factor GreB
MNKAFTKETDYDDLEEPVAEPRNVLPPGTPNYVTPEGARRVREELRQLIEVEKPRLEGLTGRSGNADGARDKEAQATARRRLREVNARIRFLEDHVGRFQVVDPAGQSSDTVRFGARVTVMDAEGDERTYLICGVDEAEPTTGRVSWISPIAKSLIGHEVGEEVVLRLPRREQTLEIVDIEYC